MVCMLDIARKKNVKTKDKIHDLRYALPGLFKVFFFLAFVRWSSPPFFCSSSPLAKTPMISFQSCSSRQDRNFRTAAQGVISKTVYFSWEEVEKSSDINPAAHEILVVTSRIVSLPYLRSKSWEKLHTPVVFNPLSVARSTHESCYFPLK